MIIGTFFAVIVSVLFAVYAVPRKFSKQNAILYTMFTGLAYLVGSIIFCTIIWSFNLREKENLLSWWHLLSVLRGFLWTVGIVLFNISIDKIGLSRFNQWKNFQGPIGSVLMLVFLSDVVGDKIIWVVLGMMAIFISAMFFTIKNPDEADKKNTFVGVILALLAACCFGCTAFIQKLLTMHGFLFSQLLYHSFFVVLSAAIIYFVQTKKPKELFRVSRETWLPVICGSLFLIATVLSVLSYTMIPGSVSFSITQLNAVWTILMGIFIFKEVSFKKHWFRISVGFVFAVGAIILLIFAL